MMQNIKSRHILADTFSFYTQGGQEYRSLSKEFETTKILSQNSSITLQNKTVNSSILLE